MKRVRLWSAGRKRAMSFAKCVAVPDYCRTTLRSLTTIGKIDNMEEELREENVYDLQKISGH